MENKKTAAQEVAGAKNAQTASAQAQPTQKAATAAPAQAGKTLDQLIKERTEQIRRQAEHANHREILLTTKQELKAAVEVLADEVKSDSFITKKAKLVLEVGDGYSADNTLHITNPKLIAGFVERICADIDVKVSELEKQLVA